jgi:hypothetical protein
MRDAVRALGIDLRAGLHTGEIELRGDDVAGMAVRIGARVSALAGPGDVLVSGTIPPLVVGSGIAFEDRDECELRGCPVAGGCTPQSADQSRFVRLAWRLTDMKVRGRYTWARIP